MLTRAGQRLDLRARLRSPLFGWALYDWANSAFATIVIAGFFPLLYREYWAAGLSDAKITLTLGIGNSAGALALLILAPWMGALSDALGRHKAFLAACVLAGAAATAALGALDAGGWRMALVVYVASTVAFMLGNVFYDSLLLEVSDARGRARASALGFALGYLGGGLALAVAAAAALAPQAWGFAGPADAMRAAFPAVALWWLAFSAPLFLRVRESPPRPGAGDTRARLLDTWRALRRRPALLWFLVAYWLYIDGVDTLIRMAVNYGRALGFDGGDLILALLMVQFVGFPATLMYGPLTDRFGARPVLFALIAAYLCLTVAAAGLDSVQGFYLLAFAVALAQGGIQSVSRAYFSLLVPPDRSAQFFGIYNLLGKFAVVIGPVLLGVVGWATGSPRAGVLAIGALFIAGAVVLWKMPTDVAAERAARG